jgi:hypothetical protein
MDHIFGINTRRDVVAAQYAYLNPVACTGSGAPRSRAAVISYRATARPNEDK